MYERKIKYTSVSLSETLMKQIQEHLNKHPGNYISAGDFLRSAARRQMELEGTYTDPQEKKIHESYDNEMKKNAIDFDEQSLKIVHEFLEFYKNKAIDNLNKKKKKKV